MTLNGLFCADVPLRNYSLYISVISFLGQARWFDSEAMTLQKCLYSFGQIDGNRQKGKSGQSPSCPNPITNQVRGSTPLPTTFCWGTCYLTRSGVKIPLPRYSSQTWPFPPLPSKLIEIHCMLFHLLLSRQRAHNHKEAYLKRFYNFW